MINNQVVKDFEFQPAMLDKLRVKLDKKPDIFSIESDPLLGSLIACLGIQYDLGKKDWDRLSAPLNINIDHQYNLLKSKLISINNDIALYIWSDDIIEFKPDHLDFKNILHPLSLDEKGLLSRLILSPIHISRYYKTMGIELAIVKSWAQSSFLASSIDMSWNYLITNELEIKTGTALMQTQLLCNQQLAFQGTHDLADHLLGAKVDSFQKNKKTFQQIQSLLHRKFFNENRLPHISKILIYLIGVLLDDLSQPHWYDSENHFKILSSSVSNLDNLHEFKEDQSNLNLPISFHELMAELRKKSQYTSIKNIYSNFISDLSKASNLN